MAALAFLADGKRKMLYRLGRFMQLAGLILLPIAISGNVAERLDLRESLSLSAVGILVFIAGWLLQQFGSPK
jgi:hypothetical protein